MTTQFTTEELAILRPEYEKYLTKWRKGYGVPMIFETWLASAADEAKERAKYE